MILLVKDAKRHLVELNLPEQTFEPLVPVELLELLQHLLNGILKLSRDILTGPELLQPNSGRVNEGRQLMTGCIDGHQ